MRYLILIFAFCIILSTCRQNEAPQTRHETSSGNKDSISHNKLSQPKSVENTVRSIRIAYGNINALALVKESFKWDADGCVDGGTVDYFFQSGEILKIVESGSIGDGSWICEYYYKSGRFIFSYDVLTGGPANGPETRHELRTYVRNDTVVRSIENKAIVVPAEKLITAGSKEYKILKAYKTRDFEAALCN